MGKTGRGLKLFVGAIMMLSGIVTAGTVALLLYISICMKSSMFFNAVLVVVAAVGITEIINGLITILKLDKSSSPKWFIITDVIIIALTVLSMFFLFARPANTIQILSGIIVPALHILIMAITDSIKENQKQ